MKKQAGFTLIEMLISVALGLLLILAVTQIFTGNKITYLLQNDMSEVQENIRFIDNHVTSALKQAGHSGCGAFSDPESNVIGAPIVGLSAGNDGIIDVYGDGGYLIESLPGADAIKVLSPGFCGIELVTDQKNRSHFFSGQHLSQCRLEEEDMLVISDCRSTEIFEASSVRHSAKTTRIKPINKLSTLYSRGATVFAINETIYFVANDKASNKRALFMSENGEPSELFMQGVNSMELIYGVDQTGNGLPDEYKKASDINADNEDWLNTLSVRARFKLETTGKSEVAKDFELTVAMRN